MLYNFKVLPKLFCAGLELTELNMRELWQALQEFWLKLYGSRLATVAAINVSMEI